MRDFLKQLFRFGLVGVVNTLIGLFIIYAIMYLFGAGLAIANFIGYIFGFIVSFILNRIWTFRDQRSIRRVLPKYLSVACASYLLNLLVVLLVNDQFKFNGYLTQLLGVVTYTVCMFLGCRYLVFSTSRESKLNT
ncbi:GtrA family protein [Paraburkholderia sp. SARCC-3016]|uniref:GtrA family protein n=1 Tax=Paraburkholderia sp. SARCC-3016 TaxID=3058611 RepID=UPI0035BE5297